MPADALLALQTTATQTASTNSTGVDLAEGTPTRGLWARVITTAVAGTSPTCVYKIQHSDDDTTYNDLAYGSEGTQSATGIVTIPFSTNKRYVRLATTIGGTAPSFTFSAYVFDGKPTTE